MAAGRSVVTAFETRLARELIGGSALFGPDGRVAARTTGTCCSSSRRNAEAAVFALRAASISSCSREPVERSGAAIRGERVAEPVGTSEEVPGIACAIVSGRVTEEEKLAAFADLRAVRIELPIAIVMGVRDGRRQEGDLNAQRGSVDMSGRR